MLQLSGLYIYPVKSLAGIAVRSAKVTDRGLEHDRRWMLVDANNRFISQREAPKMALLHPSITADGIHITDTVNLQQYLIPFKPISNQLTTATVWDDTCTAQYVSPDADAWFTKAIGIDCRLVYMPDESLRGVDPDYAPDDKVTSFADAYPFLLISQASMDDLSERTGEAISVNRFRPNLVFTGGTPYIEDEMARFRIDDIDFYGVKICARCPIPGIDQETALRVKEPLKTLNSYRRLRNKVWLGQNLIHTGAGTISVGDTITILEMKDAAVFDQN
jgi:uncharacterized protein YcbX